MAKSPVFNKGNYLKPGGQFRLRITNSFGKKTQQIGFVFIVEFEILESSLDSQKAGSKGSWMQKLSDENIAFPAIKEFLIALLGIDMSDEEEMDEFNDSCEELMENAGDDRWENMNAEKLESKGHPLLGNTIKVETYTKKTKANNTDFTVHDWEYDDTEDVED